MTGIDELSRVLGGIERGLDTVITTLADDRKSSAQYRTDVRGEFAKIVDRLAALETKDQRTQGAWDLGKILVGIFYGALALLAGFAGGYFHSRP